MFGSLMTLASGSFTHCPSSARSSAARWLSAKRSGNAAMILPESEMSFVSTVKPAPLVYALIMGSKEYVASAGASSTAV